jgi:hypothetical protein
MFFKTQCIRFRKHVFQSTRPYSTIFSSPRRRIDVAAFDNMKATLLYVLHSEAGREHGFGNRDDGYVSVKRLVSSPLALRDAPFSVFLLSLITLNFNHWI